MCMFLFSSSLHNADTVLRTILFGLLEGKHSCVYFVLCSFCGKECFIVCTRVNLKSPKPVLNMNFSILKDTLFVRNTKGIHFHLYYYHIVF
jgi:hypothetical protein